MRHVVAPSVRLQVVIVTLPICRTRITMLFLH